MTILTQKELNQAGCGIPNCDHDHSVLFLHSRCHMGRPTTVRYIKETGTISVRCAVCDSVVAEIKVAHEL